MIGDATQRFRSTFLVCGLLAICAVCASRPVLASNDQPMSFTLGRLAGSPDCGVPCAQFIVADGHIEQFSSFSYLIARKRAGDRDLPVLLNSPGGYVAGAERLARVWRKLEVTAIVAGAIQICDLRAQGKGARATTCGRNSDPSAVRTFKLAESGSRCASACTLVVAGATRRIAAETARIGLHRTHIDPTTDAARIAATLGTTNEMVVEKVENAFRSAMESLGIDPELARRAGRTPASGMEWITPEEARRYRLFNASTDDAALPEALKEALSARRK